jgi:hypothetical protein
MAQKKQNQSELTPEEIEAQEQEQKELEAQETGVPKMRNPSLQPEKPVDKATYDRYINIKFSELSGVKLTDKIKAELKELEETLKACTGKKPVRTVNAAIANETVKMVEGVPVPEFISKLVIEKGHSKYYFGE